MQVKTQLDELQDYLTDASHLKGGFASELCIANSEVEAAHFLRRANENGTPVTISGARTGTVGGAIPFGGALLSLEKLNKIVIDKEAMTATVGAGAILGDVQKAAEAEGLFYPPDPTEWSCQIGGNVATNASGARSFKYGDTRRYVRRLRVILASGENVDLRRGEVVADENGILQIPIASGKTVRVTVPTYSRPQVTKNASGYFRADAMDAVDLFIGSEGTVGVIAEIELSLLNKPEGFFSGIVFFADSEDLLAFVAEARTRSISNFRSHSYDPEISNFKSEISDQFGATLLEYFDKQSLGFISERFAEIPEHAAGAIFFEQETAGANEDALLEQWNALLERHNADLERSWFTTNEQDREKMRAFRHAMPLAANERFARNGFTKVSTDMAVPLDSFRGFLRFYDEILSGSGIEYVIFGHIGDCHLHVNLFPKTEAEATAARHIYGRCIAQAIMLGGTVSAEHGIGKIKRKYLAAMMGERYLNEMAEVKRVFDPKGILGRGNMFDETYL